MSKPSRIATAPQARAVPPGRVTTAPSALAPDVALQKRQFIEFLAARKLKLTRQREAVLDEILTNPGHFEAEEMVQRLKANRQRVSRATVYRTLDLMKECLLVERLDFGTQASFYEHVQEGEHHDHLICMRCGNVIEFHNDELEAIQSAVCRNFDFQVRYHSLRIFGLCSKCHHIHS
jgi:Fur family ferric uptake transcriptional regulator